MARMRLASGEVYDIPDNEVADAQQRFGAVPVDTATTASPGGGDNPLAMAAGVGASALEAIPKPLQYALGGAVGVGGAAIGKRLLDRARGGAPADATRPSPIDKRLADIKGAGRPAPAKLPAGVVEVTPDLKKRLKDGLKNYRVGDQIRRVELERIMRPDVSRGTKVPTRPITVEGKPARAPAQTKDPKYTGGRGASGPELERRAAFRRGEAPAGTVAARAAAEEAALARGAGHIPDPELWRTRGISAPRGQALGRVARVGGPALQILLGLLDAQSIPQQMDEADALGREIQKREMVRKGMSPELVDRLFERQQGI